MMKENSAKNANAAPRRTAPPASPKPNNRPRHEIRIGAIKAAIWKHDSEHGVRYSVTFTRMYKTDDGWKYTDSFGKDDLLTVGKVASRAQDWIYSR